MVAVSPCFLFVVQLPSRFSSSHCSIKTIVKEVGLTDRTSGPTTHYGRGQPRKAGSGTSESIGEHSSDLLLKTESVFSADGSLQVDKKNNHLTRWPFWLDLHMYSFRLPLLSCAKGQAFSCPRIWAFSSQLFTGWFPVHGDDWHPDGFLRQSERHISVQLPLALLQVLLLTSQVEVANLGIMVVVQMVGTVCLTMLFH